MRNLDHIAADGSDPVRAGHTVACTVPMDHPVVGAAAVD